MAVLSDIYAGPVVDTHFHVYDRASVPYEGLLGAKVMDADFAPADYRKAMADVDVRAGVVLNVIDRDFGFAECEYVAGIAAHEPLIATYTAFCPVAADGSMAAVDRYGAMPFVSGIRFNQVIAPDGQVPRFDHAVRTLQRLGTHGLRFELSVREHQHAALAALARACPDTTFVLGHLGKPKAATGPRPEWEEGIRCVSRQPNTVCKLTCPVDTEDDPPMTDSFLRPLIRFVIDCFGFDRVVFGTNFPTCNVATSATGWMAFLGRALHDASPGERARLYERNARTLYSLRAMPNAETKWR